MDDLEKLICCQLMVSDVFANNLGCEMRVVYVRVHDDFL